MPRAGLASGKPDPIYGTTDPGASTAAQAAHAAAQAAAQAVADRLAASMSAAAPTAPAAAASSLAPQPMATDGGGGAAAATAAEAEDAEDEATDGGSYTFSRRYTHGRVRFVDGDGLTSIDMYENLGIVGRGAFNKIYKARHRTTGEVVAMKAMMLADLQAAGQVVGDEGVPLEMVREMSILLSLRHPNLVHVHECVLDAQVRHTPPRTTHISSHPPWPAAPMHALTPSCALRVPPDAANVYGDGVGRFRPRPPDRAHESPLLRAAGARSPHTSARSPHTSHLDGLLRPSLSI